MVHRLVPLLLALFAAASSACSSTQAPDGGRSMTISFVGQLKGVTFGAERLTMQSDHGLDRVEELSKEGDPGVKLATPEIMGATYDHLLELGMQGRLRPGPLRSGTGFEIRMGSAVNHFTIQQAAELGAQAWLDMVGDFIEVYNNVLSMRAVDQEAAMQALRSGKQRAGGRR